jgi:hypothetical protein
MEILVTIGSVITLFGLVALVWCIWLVVKTRRSMKTDQEMRARLHSVAVVNMTALFVSALGLMVVLIGILVTKGL